MTRVGDAKHRIKFQWPKMKENIISSTSYFRSLMAHAIVYAMVRYKQAVLRD